MGLLSIQFNLQVKAHLPELGLGAALTLKSDCAVDRVMSH